MYADEIDDNRKQFASELNKLPMNEDNQDNIMFQILYIYIYIYIYILYYIYRSKDES